MLHRWDSLEAQCHWLLTLSLQMTLQNYYAPCIDFDCTVIVGDVEIFDALHDTNNNWEKF